jgi:membrane-associated phospholipid phosphatase
MTVTALERGLDDNMQALPLRGFVENRRERSSARDRGASAPPAAERLTTSPTVGEKRTLPSHLTRDLKLWTVSGSTGRYMAVVAGVTALFGLLDIILLPQSTLVIAAQNYVDTAKLVAAIIFGVAAARVVQWRFRDDASRLGKFIVNAAAGEHTLALACLAFGALSSVGSLFMYLASGMPQPLTDGRLASIDAWLGFDWLSLLALANANRLLAWVLVHAYFSTGLVLPLLCIYFAFTHRDQHLMELVALVAIASLFTGILMLFFPAAGAYSWFRPSPDCFSNLSSEAGMWHHKVLVALRSGQRFTYLQSHVSGLVTFPSFHTVLGVITTYSVRRIRGVFPVLLVVNAIMIVSTVPEGGHYVVDVVAGAVVALLSILGVRAACGK